MGFKGSVMLLYIDLVTLHYVSTYVMTVVGINECVSSPCQNGGTCTDLLNGYQCSCASSYTGLNCERSEQKMSRLIQCCLSFLVVNFNHILKNYARDTSI